MKMNMSSWTSTQDHGAAAHSQMGEKQGQANGEGGGGTEEPGAQPAQPEPAGSFRLDSTGSDSADEW